MSGKLPWKIDDLGNSPTTIFFENVELEAVKKMSISFYRSVLLLGINSKEIILKKKRAICIKILIATLFKMAKNSR